MDDTKITYLYCFAGEGLPCVLKGFFFGILFMKKRGMVFFWGQDIEK